MRVDPADGMIEALHAETGIDRWFLAKLRSIVRMEHAWPRTAHAGLLRAAKRLGFADQQIAALPAPSRRARGRAALRAGLRRQAQAVSTDCRPQPRAPSAPTSSPRR